MGNELFVRSAQSGYVWYISADSSAEQNVEFIDVANSSAYGGATIVAMNSVGETQNNANWVFISLLPGETNTWTGAANSLWGVAENWSRNRAPVETDVIVIPADCPNYPVFDASRQIDRLIIEEDGLIDLNGYDLTVNLEFNLQGQLIAREAERIACSGELDFSGGSLTPTRSTIVLVGTQSQVANLAGLTFYTIKLENDEEVLLQGDFDASVLRCVQPNGMQTIVFEANRTVTVRDFLFEGDVSGPNIHLVSSDPGTSWKLNVSGTRRISGVAVSDSDASGGLTVLASDSLDNGGNQNWLFDAPVSYWTPVSGVAFHNPVNWSSGFVPGPNTRVWIKEGSVAVNTAITVLDLMVGGGVSPAAVTANVPVTVRETLIVLENGALSLNKPSSVAYDLVVASGGMLTHSVNPATEENKLELSVAGNMTVEEGGHIDLMGKGHMLRTGPGATGGGQGTMGDSYGGRGAIYGSATPAPGPCYGSILSPTNLGSGGARSGSYGGGAIIANVTGTFRNDGVICADGLDNETHYQATGGSVFLTAGNIIGAGKISADGGVMLAGGYASAAGGGRISMVITNRGVDFSNYTGPVMARPTVLLPLEVNAQNGGPGTIYQQTAEYVAGRGIVTIDGLNLSNVGFTDVPLTINSVPGESDYARFHVLNGAKLRLLDDYTVGDIWLDSANAVLDLGGRTLYVNQLPHDLGPGTVINYGEIKWITGTMLFFW
ncbi:MAG: hypothetical protein GX811_06660 [Lentisphaerae bacterium]|nr:hypothetical protein [Lentisphaerota bacterium]